MNTVCSHGMGTEAGGKRLQSRGKAHTHTTAMGVTTNDVSLSHHMSAYTIAHTTPHHTEIRLAEIHTDHRLFAACLQIVCSRITDSSHTPLNCALTYTKQETPRAPLIVACRFMVVEVLSSILRA